MTSKWDNKALVDAVIPAMPLNTEKRSKVVIASLTSYPARINYVALVIKSLLLQSYKPDRIILWLAEEQFQSKELPKNLTEFKKYGVEIKRMRDLFGHKKYFYPVKEQKKNELVITFDDDILYSPKCIERLMKTHNKYPNCLVCERGQVFEDKLENNPGKWITISDIGVYKPTFSMNPSPGGGCLIPLGAENGTQMIKTRKYHKIFTIVEGSQVEQMAIENVVNDKNVVIMEGLKHAYPIAWKRIHNDML